MTPPLPTTVSRDTWTMPEGDCEVTVVRPDADGPHPGVLLLMDAIGLRPRIDEMAARIASWGYVVAAPNTFWREGRAQDLAPTTDLTVPGNRDAFFEVALPRVGRLTPDLVLADARLYLRGLAAIDGVTGGPVGLTGYCMGANHALRIACAHPVGGPADEDGMPGVAAVGGFHGGRLATPDADSAHLGLRHATAEFVFGHADDDPNMPADAIARLGAALDAADLTATNEVYAGAAHGFTMADTVMYDEAATERHFAELEALLSRTLGR